jgi:3-oxoacyl-[acyl-carrier-protein] synthase-3
MTSAVVEGVRIRGFASGVPEHESPLSNDYERFGKDAVRRIVSSTGIKNRRLASEGLSAADLCQAAADRLMKSLNWQPESVELLIFLSQTGDFVIPATACALQDRLGLPKTAVAFDVPLGCSSYAYGLWIASSLLLTLKTTRALILVGDTLTAHVSKDDRALWPLFGDAGTATAIEVDLDAPPMFFEFGTDGSGFKHLLIDKAVNGDVADQNLHMDGVAVFSFSLREVPPMVKRLLESSHIEAETIDKWVFHQANEFILRNLQKRLKIPNEKFVVDLANWGNTSGATIPLAICSSLREDLRHRNHLLLLAGFGVGLSWSAAIVEIPQSIVIPEIIEIKPIAAK